ncbi:MAG: 23S rRNA pseudouridine2457 synthase [Planctomycetaceae bacterium]|jgi:23S rRNA pseudouridine2457 synthase
MIPLVGTSVLKKMSNLLLFNKPFGVLTQFRASADKITLARYIDRPNFYPAGRLDEQSEGLLLLTDDGKLQARIAHPKFKLPKTYWAQVEGVPGEAALEILRDGVSLKDGRTRPAEVQRLENAPRPPRVPPIRVRKNILDSWLELTITEGKNRQVRRMTAAVGFPTLRLFRTSIGPWNLKDLAIGESRLIKVNLPN